MGSIGKYDDFYFAVQNLQWVTMRFDSKSGKNFPVKSNKVLLFGDYNKLTNITINQAWVFSVS